MAGENPADQVRADAASAADEVAAAVRAFLDERHTSGGDVDKTQRRRIVDAANALIAAVKDPADEWFDATAEVARLGANRLFWEWKAYDAIPVEGSISYAELAGKVEAEEALIREFGDTCV